MITMILSQIVIGSQPQKLTQRVEECSAYQFSIARVDVLLKRRIVVFLLCGALVHTKHLKHAQLKPDSYIATTTDARWKWCHERHLKG